MVGVCRRKGGLQRCRVGVRRAHEGFIASLNQDFSGCKALSISGNSFPRNRFGLIVGLRGDVVGSWKARWAF